MALDGDLSAVEIPELVDERFIGEVVEVPIQERSSGQTPMLATRCVLRATPSRWEACFAADDESRSALRAVVELPGSRQTVRVPWTQVRPLQWPLWMPDRNRGCGWNLSMGVSEDDVGSVVMVDDTSSVRLLSDSGTQVLPRLWPMRLLAAPTLEEVTAEGEDESVLELMVEIESIDRYMRTARSFAPWVSARPNHVDGRTVVRRYAPRATRLGGSNHQPVAAAANGVV